MNVVHVGTSEFNLGRAARPHEVTCRGRSYRYEIVCVNRLSNDQGTLSTCEAAGMREGAVGRAKLFRRWSPGCFAFL